MQSIGIRTVCKTCVSGVNPIVCRSYSHGAVRRRFLIPYVYRSKTFNIHTESNFRSIEITQQAQRRISPQRLNVQEIYPSLTTILTLIQILKNQKSKVILQPIRRLVKYTWTLKIKSLRQLYKFYNNEQKQTLINELYEKQQFEKGLVAAQDALSVFGFVYHNVDFIVDKGSLRRKPPCICLRP